MLVTVHSLIYTLSSKCRPFDNMPLTNLQVVIIQGKVHYLNVFPFTIESQSYFC